MKVRDIGGFFIPFDDNGIYGRDSDDNNFAAVEGDAWDEAFHHQNGFGFGYALHFLL